MDRQQKVILSLSLLLLVIVLGYAFYASDYRRQLWLTEYACNLHTCRLTTGGIL